MLSHLGKENKNIADKAATDIMRYNLNKLNIRGEVVIGEGELDQAPMLYIGEKLETAKVKKLISQLILLKVQIS